MIRLLSIFLFFSCLFGKSYPFKDGESLHYKALFSGIEAGKGLLEVIGKDIVNNTSVLHVRFSAKTHGFIDHLYPINDVIDIWLNENSLLPIKVKKYISQGNYKKEREIYLDQESQYAIIKGDTISIPEIIHSPYSLLYFLRNKDLESLNNKRLSIIDNKNPTTIKMQIHKNIDINLELGQFNCTKVSPVNIDEKKFKNESSMSIWFTNDSKKYPAQIAIKMKFGTLILKLFKIIN